MRRSRWSVPAGCLALLLAAGTPVVGAGVDVQAYEAYAAYKSGDYPRAYRLWREAADRGNSAAMNNLANLYLQGQGVPRDLQRAADWYRRSAEAGDPVGQTHLGNAYEAGQGVPRDNARAAYWFRRAAEQGDAEAQRNLGVMLATDHGRGLAHSTPEQRREAVQWLERASAAGQREAASLLEILRRLLDEQAGEAEVSAGQ